MSETVFMAAWLAVCALAFGFVIGTTTREERAKRRATMTAPANSSTKFCRDCRWAYAEPRGVFGQRHDWGFAKCLHPTSMRSAGTFMATGEHSPDNAHYCSSVREYSGKDQCGINAAHFEQRSGNGHYRLPYISRAH